MVIISADLWICMLELLFKSQRQKLTFLSCTADGNHEFCFHSQISSLMLFSSSFGTEFILLSLNAIERASRGETMTIPIIVSLCLWNYSRLIQIVKVFRGLKTQDHHCLFSTEAYGSLQKVTDFSSYPKQGWWCDFKPTHHHMTKEACQIYSLLILYRNEHFSLWIWLTTKSGGKFRYWEGIWGLFISGNNQENNWNAFVRKSVRIDRIEKRP